MPKYSFTCLKCGYQHQCYTSRNVKELACEICHSNGDKNQMMRRQLPKLFGNPDVSETIDTYTNTVHREDHQESVQQRRDEYYWTVEVPRFVNSGKYSIETMLEMGWVHFDEKQQLKINTVPPHRR